jgi:ABC-2 type transport system ATP-binding protein
VPVAWQARVLRSEGEVHFIGLARYADLEGLLAALRAEDIAIADLALQEADLEQVFLRIMGGERGGRTSGDAP